MSIQYDPTKVGQQAEILGGVHTSAGLAKLYTNVPAGSVAYTSDSGQLVFNGQYWASPLAAGSTQTVMASASAADRTPIIGPGIGTVYGWEGNVAQEPNVWFNNGLYHMLYSAGLVNGSIGYAYATNPQGPWTKPLTTPVIGNGQGGTTAGQYLQHTGMYIEGSSIYIVSSIAAVGSVIIWSAPLNFAPSAGPVFTQFASSVFALPSGFNAWGNFALIPIVVGSKYALLAEARTSSGTITYQTGLATYSGALSPSMSFTVSTFPLTQLASTIKYWGGPTAVVTYGGPFITVESGLCVLYYHAGPSGGAPTDIFRATSPVTDLVNWTNTNNGFPVFQRKNILEVDQVGDPSIVQGPAGDWWLFSDAVDNLNGKFYLMAIPMFSGAAVSSNGNSSYLLKQSDQFGQQSFNAPVYLGTGVTTYTALNRDDIHYNNGVNNLVITAPRASFDAFFRVSNWNAGGHSLTVNINAADYFGYDTSGTGGSCVVNAGETLTFTATQQNSWSLSRPPIGTPATGAQTATFTATNKPGVGTNAPTLWLPYYYKGTLYYIPLFGA